MRHRNAESFLGTYPRLSRAADTQGPLFRSGPNTKPTSFSGIYDSSSKSQSTALISTGLRDHNARIWKMRGARDLCCKSTLLDSGISSSVKKMPGVSKRFKSVSERYQHAKTEPSIYARATSMKRSMKSSDPNT